MIFLPATKACGAVFDSSWKRLSESEQELFMKLSVFKDGFSLDSAAVVVGSGKDSMAFTGANLVKKSMLKANPENGAL